MAGLLNTTAFELKSIGVDFLEKKRAELGY
jgi:hypothetical protein